MARKGDKTNPWLITPSDWHENGVPYGDYCKCNSCGLVARSTMAFDYYAEGPGLPMDCESCKFRRPKAIHKITDDIAAKILAEDN